MLIAKDSEIRSNFSNDEIKSYFGVKVYGLTFLPQSWVPSFFVLTTDFISLWISTATEERKKLIAEELWDVIISYMAEGESIILRSSITVGGLKYRGKYDSKIYRLHPNELFNGISDLYNLFQQVESCKAIDVNHRLAIIIQAYKRPSSKGHISNERRVSRNSNHWTVETEFPNITTTTLIEDNSIDLSEDLTITSRSLAKDIFKKVVQYANNKLSKRCHLEWIVSGNRVYIVQLDLEKEFSEGNILLDSPFKKPQIKGNFDTKHFKSWRDSKMDLGKLECLRVFELCNLPVANVFVLEDEEVLRNLAKGSISDGLRSDIIKFLKFPIVVRTDISESLEFDNLLLPRSDTLFEVEQVIDFLIETVKKIKENRVPYSDFAFLIHHFIFAPKCAFTTIDKEKDRVTIHSLYGVPDSLLYYNHDTINAKISNKQRADTLEKKVKYKPNYIQVNSEGNWTDRRVPVPYDWKLSLTNEEINIIVKQTKKIAEKKDTPVNIMFLVGVNNSDISSSILPWYYYESNSDRKFNTNDELETINREIVKVKKPQDISRLSDIINKKKEIIVDLSPTIAFIRDKGNILKLAKICNDQNILVKLRGSILSHIYYLLTEKGVRVVT